jgi:hypothetical protein
MRTNGKSDDGPVVTSPRVWTSVRVRKSEKKKPQDYGSALVPNLELHFGWLPSSIVTEAAG